MSGERCDGARSLDLPSAVVELKVKVQSREEWLKAAEVKLFFWLLGY